MSAYVVDDITINKVVSFLEVAAWSNEVKPGHSPSRILKRAGYDLTNDEVCEQLAHDMFKLNVRAVEARYGEGEAAEFRPLNFRYQPTFDVNAVQAFKALQCWAYQCAEGDIPETELYKLMVEVGNSLAVDIVSHSETYQKAPWG